MRYQWTEIYEIIELMPLEEKKHLQDYIMDSIKRFESNASYLTYLEKHWIEIKRCMRCLDYEPDIDEQIEIEEKIWGLCEDLIKSGKIVESSWEIRKEILQDIILGEYFDEYGVSVPMKRVFSSLCTSREERIISADMCFKFGSGLMKKDGATIYLENGIPEKYYEFMEKCLSTDGKQYLELIEYYKSRDYVKALELAELAMKKCKTNLTEIVIFLLHEYTGNGNSAKCAKLMKSAQLRKAVNYAEVHKALEK